jgi:hypothetical protein
VIEKPLMPGSIAKSLNHTIAQLFHFFVRRMLTATIAELFEFQPFCGRLSVLGRRIIPLFAITAL